jgi:hypothetical protein
LNVLLGKLAVASWSSLWLDQALFFEKTKFRRRKIWEIWIKNAEHLTDSEQFPTGGNCPNVALR